MGVGAGGQGSRVESWLQGTAITHQRPGQPSSLCALRSRPCLATGPQPWTTPPLPHRSRARVGEGLGIVCGQSAAAGTMRKGGDQGRLPGGGECGDEMDRGEARGEWLRAKGRKNGVGLGRQGGERRGRGRGRTSKVSVQPPDGESWRDKGRGPLPAPMAILGPESNQIRGSPQSPQQLRTTAVPPRALSAGTSLPAPR